MSDEEEYSQSGGDLFEPDPINAANPDDDDNNSEEQDNPQDEPEEITPEEGNPEEGNPEEGTPEGYSPEDVYNLDFVYLEEGNSDEGNLEEGNPDEGNPDEEENSGNNTNRFLEDRGKTQLHNETSFHKPTTKEAPKDKKIDTAKKEEKQKTVKTPEREEKQKTVKKPEQEEKQKTVKTPEREEKPKTVKTPEREEKQKTVKVTEEERMQKPQESSQIEKDATQKSLKLTNVPKEAIFMLTDVEQLKIRCTKYGPLSVKDHTSESDGQTKEGLYVVVKDVMDPVFGEGSYGSNRITYKYEPYKSQKWQPKVWGATKLTLYPIDLIIKFMNENATIEDEDSQALYDLVMNALVKGETRLMTPEDHPPKPRRKKPEESAAITKVKNDNPKRQVVIQSESETEDIHGRNGPEYSTRKDAERLEHPERGLLHVTKKRKKENKISTNLDQEAHQISSLFHFIVNNWESVPEKKQGEIKSEAIQAVSSMLNSWNN